MRLICFSSLCALLILLLVGACEFYDTRVSNIASKMVCTDLECINQVCPDYEPSVTTNSNLCRAVGNCQLPDMPVTSQLSIPVRGDIACGPTAAHMALDSLIKSSTLSTSGWLNQYSSLLSPQPSSITVQGCPAGDTNCKKVLKVAEEIIGEPWTTNSAKPVTSNELASFMSDVKIQKTPTGDSFNSGNYPTNIRECDFVSGAYAIDESTPWNNVLLYLSYSQSVEATGEHHNKPMSDISLKAPSTGHFITMNGYTVTRLGVLYRFHCPIYGIKHYFMKTARLNQPFCVSFKEGVCQQFVRVVDMPQHFSPLTDSFSYLVEIDGEQNANNYRYRIVANVSGIM